MKQFTLAIAFLLLPALAADAASALQRKKGAPAAPKGLAAEPAPVFSPPPVTRLPVAPDEFRA